MLENIEYDQWLSDCTGFPCYNMAESNSSKRLQTVYNSQNMFVTYKTSIEYTDLDNTNGDEKFIKINSQLTFSGSLPVDHIIARNNTFSAEFGVKQHEKKNVLKFADYFTNDRFRADERLPTCWSRKIKRKWILSNQSAQSILKFSYKSNIVGVLIFKDLSQCIVIDLIAVDPSYRGQKVATNMIYRLNHELGLKKKITVGTQNDNSASVKLYRSLGFEVTKHKHVYHYYKNYTR